MTRSSQLASTEFCEHIPRELEDGVLYISMKYRTAIHQCMCGCGTEVVTPFGRDSWTLSYDGEAVSLRPSIGNAKIACKSHYFIRDGRIIWLPPEEDELASKRGRRPKRGWFRRFGHNR
jgi:hypothetical protein